MEQKIYQQEEEKNCWSYSSDFFFVRGWGGEDGEEVDAGGGGAGGEAVFSEGTLADTDASCEAAPSGPIDSLDFCRRDRNAAL